MNDLIIDRIAAYKENKQRVLQNKVNGIPLQYVFPKLSRHIPALPKGIQVMITAGSGIGKSKSWTGIFLYSIYKTKKLKPELKLNVKLLIALLEDTKEQFVDRLFGLILFDKYQIEADGKTLNSFGRLLPEDVERRLEDVGKEVQEILDMCEIVDNIYNPTGIYKWARNISEELGEHKYELKEYKHTTETGELTIEQKSQYLKYIPHDPEQHVLLVVDNMNNFALEKNEGVQMKNQLEAINRWSRDYGRLQITKHWKWTVLNILQQSAQSETPQYNYKGELVIDKIKPSLDNLGNSKECQRDHHLIFGLFAPDRFGIDSYEGVNIAEMRDTFRSFIILKSNISSCNIEVFMYFNGAASYFRELF